MYDQYPMYDVPQNNLIQRFFAQRWSAITLEIVMTVVITIAAGAAFDFFDPLDQKGAASAEVVAGAVDIEPVKARDPLAFIWERGAEYTSGRRFAAAEAMFDWAIALAPERMENYSWRGYVNLQAGDYIGAQADYRKVLEQKPRNFDAHSALCWAYGETRDFAQAAAHCQAALDIAFDRGEFAIALENWCWLQV